MEINFENLTLLPEIVNTLKALQEDIDLFKPNLTDMRNVMLFLDVSKATVYNYVNQGIFEEGVHFYKDESDKCIFIPQGIILFKKMMIIPKENISMASKKKDFMKTISRVA